MFFRYPNNKNVFRVSKSFEKVSDKFDVVNNTLIEIIATMAEKERKKIRERQLKDSKTKKKVLDLIKKKLDIWETKASKVILESKRL